MPKRFNKRIVAPGRDSPTLYCFSFTSSMIQTEIRSCLKRIAVATPAGPAPTTITSNLGVKINCPVALWLQIHLVVLH